MALVTRQLSNAGAPLTDTAGEPLAGATISFELVDALGSPADTFDAATGARVYGTKTATLDANGEFTIGLWPNDRGLVTTLYRCEVNHPSVDGFMGIVPDDAGALAWYVFKNISLAYTPAQNTELGIHVANRVNPHSVTKAQVGLGNADNTSDVDKPVSAAQAAADAGITAALGSHASNTSNPHNVTKAQVGLGNADNTSDVDKPVSTAAQAALDLKAPLASPALTGTPTGPTAAPGTSTSQLATTEFVTAADNLKAPLISPALTGAPTAPTAAPGTKTTQLATTDFAQQAASSKGLAFAIALG